MNTPKKAYEAPQLKRWGDVATLTKVGQTHPGTDIRQGSVNPPGHDNNPGLGT
ncbi:MAG TPA: lasso RiPP family leader peptide-containing protein [Trueperaceae bacterium]